jgi:tetraacyldisaccharide 4'-kinase
MKRVAARLASGVWSVLSSAARRSAELGAIHAHDLGVRVISVGNIQVGGAGKTPLVAQIAREAVAKGMLPCILCRGYGGEWESEGGVIAPGEPMADPDLCGDEPALLHDLIPEAWIGVGGDRVRSYERIRARVGERPPDLVLLDDGFQHHRIKKNIEIVAVTSAGRGDVLFRDRPEALKHCDLAVWTKGETEPEVHGAPLVRVRYRLPPYTGKRDIWLVTGLADGRSAFELGRESGYPVTRHIPFPDHARYAPEIVQGILSEAQKAGARVAITGKDWVKWRKLGVQPLQLEVLEPELVFEKGRDLWDRILWG